MINFFLFPLFSPTLAAQSTNPLFSNQTISLTVYLVISFVYITIMHFAVIGGSEFVFWQMIFFFVLGGAIGYFYGYELGLMIAILSSLIFVSNPKKDI